MLDLKNSPPIAGTMPLVSNRTLEQREADREAAQRNDYQWFRDHPGRYYNARCTDPGECDGPGVVFTHMTPSRAVIRRIVPLSSAAWALTGWKRIARGGSFTQSALRNAFNRASGHDAEAPVGSTDIYSGSMLLPTKRLFGNRSMEAHP